MTTVTRADIDAALKHLGWDSYDDLFYWASSNNEMNRFDDLAKAFATHREAAEQAGAKAMQWQDISTAPKDGRPILVFGGRHTTVNMVAADGAWWNLKGAPLSSIPAHWMPLPAPPALDPAQIAGGKP